MTESVNLAEKYKFKIPSHLDPADPILVVDDQQDLRLIIVHHLGKLQFKKIYQAANGLEALEAIRSHKISAIVCAMNMPNMSGLDLLTEIRENIHLSRPPFCLTMSNVSRDKIMLSIEHGVDEILVKPFTFSDILPKLKKAFKIFHNPKNPEKVYELAKDYLKNEKFDEAAEIFEELHQVSPKIARPLVGLARLEFMRDNDDVALEYLEKAEKNNPNYVHIYSLRGDIFCKKEQFEEALVCYHQGIDMSPLNPMRYMSAVKVLMELKKYQETADLLAKAIKSQVNFPELFNYMSQAYFQLKDYKQAIKSIRQALILQPDNILFLNQLGIAYKESGQFQEATQTYNKIIKLDPANIPALFNKSILLQQAGQIVDAIKIIERILVKDPDQSQAKQKLKELEDIAAKQRSVAGKNDVA